MAKILYEYCIGWPDQPKWLQGRTRLIRSMKGNTFFRFDAIDGTRMPVILSDDGTLLGKVAGKWAKVGRLTTGFNKKTVAFVGPDDVPSSYEAREIRFKMAHGMTRDEWMQKQFEEDTKLEAERTLNSITSTPAQRARARMILGMPAKETEALEDEEETASLKAWEEAE